MRKQKRLAPLVVRCDSISRGIYLLSFLKRRNGKLQEKPATRLYTTQLLKEFLRRWSNRGGEIIDLRSSAADLRIKQLRQQTTPLGQRKKPRVQQTHRLKQKIVQYIDVVNFSSSPDLEEKPAGKLPVDK